MNYHAFIRSRQRKRWSRTSPSTWHTPADYWSTRGRPRGENPDPPPIYKKAGSDRHKTKSPGKCRTRPIHHGGS